MMTDARVISKQQYSRHVVLPKAMRDKEVYKTETARQSYK